MAELTWNETYTYTVRNTLNSHTLYTQLYTLTCENRRGLLGNLDLNSKESTGASLGAEKR